MAIVVLLEALSPKLGRRGAYVRGLQFQVTFIFTAILLARPFELMLLKLNVPLLPPLEQWAGWMAFPIAFIVLDFFAYWEHRFEHRFFWSVHSVHHAIDDLHAVNSYGHPFQVLPTFMVITVPLALLNISSPTLPLTLAIAKTMLVFYIHSPIDMHFGPLRKIFVDNRYHRIHHSVEERHFDTNFGITLTIWDQIFRTVHFPARDEWPEVGLKDQPMHRNLAAFLCAPFANIARDVRARARRSHRSEP